MRFVLGHANRTMQRPPLGPDDYTVEDRGFESPCWIRRGHLNNKGYGSVSVAGKLMYAHRAMYEQEVGPIPEGLTIDHLCRVRSCMRPSHLEPVPMGENLRRGKGAKLTAEDVARIRADTRLQREIAEEYGIHPAHVSKIRAGKKWA